MQASLLVFLRILAALLAGVAVKYFTFWLSFAFTFGVNLKTFMVVASVLSWVLAITGAALAWRLTKPLHLPRTAAGGALMGAAMLGVIGFLGGFFGGRLIWPESNLAPLLGFLTGPAGIAFGAPLGGIFGGLHHDDAVNDGIHLVPPK